MINPTTIKKTSTKEEHTRFYTIAYNGQELGRLGIFNVFTGGGVQGVRIKWQGHNEPLKIDQYVLDFTDKDKLGNIRHTK